MTAADAVAGIPPGARIVIQSGAAEPSELTRALVDAAAGLGAAELTGGVLLGGYGVLTAADSRVRVRTWFPPGTLLSGSCGFDRLEYLPLTWAQVHEHIERQRFDAALIQVSPADARGFHSFGVSTSFSSAMVGAARLVIAEVNPAMPVTPGDSAIHASEIDILVPVEHPLIEFPQRPPGEIHRHIAERVVELIPSGATIQVGVGSTPAAIVDALIAAGRERIRPVAHLGDATLRLVRSDSFDSNTPAVVGEIGGTQQLYEWARTATEVHMATARRTHRFNPEVHATPFVSVNSALSVDLGGQVNTEYLEGFAVGLVGGILDFHAIAHADPANRSVVAMPSVTGKGQSRIVSLLGRPAAISRPLTRFVVTEWGIADLRDASAAERARKLIAVAHPDHRQALRRDLGGF